MKKARNALNKNLADRARIALSEMTLAFVGSGISMVLACGGHFALISAS